MKRILIPTDFSATSYNAVEFAMNLYKGEQNIIYLLHSIYDSGEILHSSVYDIYKKQAEIGLGKVENMMKIKFPDSKITFKKIPGINLLGDAVEEIVESEDIDLVIMGTRGASGMQELLFGSYTVSTLKKVSCPLLVIPSTYRFRLPEKIVLATDYTVSFNDYPLENFIAVAEKYNAEVDVLHINNGKCLSKTQLLNKHYLSLKLIDLKADFQEVKGANIEEAIFDYEKNNPIDLLVMIKNKHSLLEKLFAGSNINRIGYHTSFPFLVLPEPILEVYGG